MPIAIAGCSTRSRMRTCDVADMSFHSASLQRAGGEQRVAEGRDRAADAGEDEGASPSADGGSAPPGAAHAAAARRPPSQCAVSVRHRHEDERVDQVRAP